MANEGKKPKEQKPKEDVEKTKKEEKGVPETSAPGATAGTTGIVHPKAAGKKKIGKLPKKNKKRMPRKQKKAALKERGGPGARKPKP